MATAKPKMMEVCSVDRAGLKQELQYLQGVIERKQTIPALSTVLFETSGKTVLTLSGTDLDVYLTCRTTAEVKKKAAFCVSAHLLLDVLKVLPDESVDLGLEGEGDSAVLHVKCGDCLFSLATSPKETFPELPEFKATPITLASAVFAGMIDRTIFAVTKEESRYTLSGGNLELDKAEKVLRLITTDGHRLSYTAIKNVKVPSDASVLLSRKTMVEMRKLLNDCEEFQFGLDEADGKEKIEGAHSWLFLHMGNRKMISRLVGGQFPNYKMIMPKENGNTAQINCSALKQSLRRVSLFADDLAHGVRLGLGKNKLQLTASSTDKGTGKDAMKIDFDGPGTEIGFNYEYLLDFLHVVKEEDMSMSFKDANAQAKFESVPPDEAIEHLYILMPMRL